MIVEYASHPQFISNTYLVADGEGGPAFFIDAGGPVAPLIKTAERLGLTPTHVLLTHHHFDHVSEVERLRERWPGLRVLISGRERDLLAGSQAADGAASTYDGIEAGQALRFGKLEVRPLHTPGHTAGMLSFLVGEHSEPGAVPAEGPGRHRAARARRPRRAASRALTRSSSQATHSSRAPSAASKRRGTRPTPICAIRSWAP